MCSSVCRLKFQRKVANLQSSGLLDQVDSRGLGIVLHYTGPESSGSSNMRQWGKNTVISENLSTSTERTVVFSATRVLRMLEK